MPDSDPRVFFAAERTLLAWLRTGIAVIGLGFVVARFGLFLRIVSPNAEKHPIGSAFIGVVLVLLGGVAIYAAALQHLRFVRRLNSVERPPDAWTGLSLWVALATATAAIVLAGYLIFA